MSIPFLFLPPQGEKTRDWARRLGEAAPELEIIAPETMEGAEQYRQELQEERARSVALASELATSRTVIESMTMLLQETEQQIAELRSSQQLERERSATLEKDSDAAPQAMTSGAEQRRALKKARASAAALASELATRAKDTSQSARLIARASALLGQRNIGAARIVLERVAETGNAKANFMLAETYDPAVLSAWGAFGTRGEAAKAREFYARAHAGGIQEAKDRSDALHQ